MDLLSGLLILGIFACTVLLVRYLVYLFLKYGIKPEPLFQEGDSVIFSKRVGKRRNTIIYKIISINRHYRKYTVEIDGKFGTQAFEIEFEFLEKHFKKTTHLDNVLYNVKYLKSLKLL